MADETGWLCADTDRREDRPANVAMIWIPEDGKRPKGRPQKTWHTTFTEHFGVTRRGAKKIANDRQRWKNHVT